MNTVLDIAAWLLIAIAFAIHGLISLIGSKGQHFSWVVFLAISCLVFFA